MPTETETKANTAEVEKLKTQLSKSNSEAAEYKRQLKAKMTESEQAEAARIEADKAMREELDAWRRKDTENQYRAKLMDNGYDADTALRLAATLPDGVGDDFFAAQKVFLDNAITKAKGDALNNQPAPSAGMPLTAEQNETKLNDELRKFAGLA